MQSSSSDTPGPGVYSVYGVGDKDKFLNDLKSLEGHVVVGFFYGQCGHCKAMQSEWKKLAHNKNSGITTLSVYPYDDSTGSKDDAKEMATSGGLHDPVGGFPEIKLFMNGKLVKSGGPRKEDGIIEWVHSS